MLKSISDEAEETNVKMSEKVSTAIQQKYNWVAVQLQITNAIVEPMLNMFWMRGVDIKMEQPQEDTAQLDKGSNE